MNVESVRIAKGLLTKCEFLYVFISIQYGLKAVIKCRTVYHGSNKT